MNDIEIRTMTDCSRLSMQRCRVNAVTPGSWCSDVYWTELHCRLADDVNIEHSYGRLERTRTDIAKLSVHSQTYCPINVTSNRLRFVLLSIEQTIVSVVSVVMKLYLAYGSSTNKQR